MSTDARGSSHQDLAATFRRFAVREAIPGDSPLYAALCDAIAKSPDLLDLASGTGPTQQAPNLLLAAIHLHVRREPASPLAAYFPSVGGRRTPDEQLPGALAEFCLRRRAGLVQVLESRFVQTNEVRRTACLLPAFSAVHRESGLPLSLLEVGCSAGLNLMFDRYWFDYSNGTTSGDVRSPVRVNTLARGFVPAEGVAIPPVAGRAGVDINPLDVSDPADLEWLQALIWPEHSDRRDLLGAAAAIARRELPPLVRGDAIEEVERMAAEVPPSQALVVFAAFVLHQIPAERRAEFRKALERIARSRPLWFIPMGFADFVTPRSIFEDGSTGVWLARLDEHGARQRQVVHCHPHGRWMELLARQEYEPIAGTAPSAG